MNLDLEKVVSEQALYSLTKLTATDIEILSQAMVDNYTMDCFCTKCGQDSIFFSDFRTTFKDISHRPVQVTKAKDMIKALFIEELQVNFKCSRNSLHEIILYIRIGCNSIMKIGQFPSIADIAFGTIARYRKVLKDDQMMELKKAIGLASHGIGIGSFIYLRRIFEKMLDDHKKVRKENDGEIVGWENMRVADRIECLKDSLPSFLVKNKSIYGILSKGIHELDENTCLKYFPILKEAIYMIMDEDESKRVENERKKEIEKLISGIMSETT